MPSIDQSYTIEAPIDAVWRALTDPKEIDNWGAGPARMSETIGSDFELWGGDISGKNIEVESPNRLVQEWRYGDWPKPSIVTFELKSLDGKTEIRVTQTDHPDTEHQDLESGWRGHYLGAMKEYLENE